MYLEGSRWKFTWSWRFPLRAQADLLKATWLLWRGRCCCSALRTEVQGWRHWQHCLPLYVALGIVMSKTCRGQDEVLTAHLALNGQWTFFHYDHMETVQRHLAKDAPKHGCVRPFVRQSFNGILQLSEEEAGKTPPFFVRICRTSLDFARANLDTYRIQCFNNTSSELT